MPKYMVKWNYRSSLGGPYEAGQALELDAEQAAAINRDSPGVLEDTGAHPVDDLTAIAGIGEAHAQALRAAGVFSYDQLAQGDPAELAQILASAGAFELQPDQPEGFELADVVRGWQADLARLQGARQDRMVRKSRRRDRQGDPGDQGPITRADFRAVKGGK